MASKPTRSARERHEREREQVHGTETTWALRAVLLGYGDLNREIAHRLGLGVNDVAAMEHLMESPDLGPVDLADRLGMTTASVTALLDRLELAGHVRRGEHPTDRRRRVLEVTEHAHTEVLRVLQPLLDDLVALDAEFTAKERTVVTRYLHRVAQIYDDYLA